METAPQMANRLMEALLNGTWIANTNYKNELPGLPVAVANTKVGSLNSIAALAQHINYYLAGIINVFKGGELDIKDKFSFDFPPLETQEEWNAVLDKFFANAEEMCGLIENCPKKSSTAFLWMKNTAPTAVT